jgi:hypothetical protein
MDCVHHQDRTVSKAKKKNQEETVCINRHSGITIWLANLFARYIVLIQHQYLATTTMKIYIIIIIIVIIFVVVPHCVVFPENGEATPCSQGTWKCPCNYGLGQILNYYIPVRYHTLLF